MARYLYRRTSGIYVVRICVPHRLQMHVGRRELHVSTQCRDPASAKAAAFAILTAWQQRVIELSSMDVIKISEGSPLFTGEGHVRLEDMEQALGLGRQALLTEIRNSKADLLCVADGWHGFEVQDIDSIERDFDGSYVINDAIAQGSSVHVVGVLMLSSTTLAVEALTSTGVFSDCLFWRDSNKRKAVFLDLPGQEIPYAKVLIGKRTAERIRVRLAAGVTPAMLISAKETLVRPAPSVMLGSLAAKRSEKRAADLLEEFLEAKKPRWKPDRQERMAKMCGRFVELMDNPRLVEIDRPFVQAYRKRLLQLPENIRKAQQRYGASTLKELIQVASDHDETRLTEQTAGQYVDMLSEMLNWAVTEEYMERNPAKGVTSSVKPKTREQDQRQQFDEADLVKIFSAEWFSRGAGAPNRFGRYQQFLPFYFWMPLLGLLTGGRLNELAQLYLKDLKQDGADGWYLDFNLDGADKLESDHGNEQEVGGDKSLKTVNSERQIPLHRKLVELGLPEYAQALKMAGHERLFPELSHDRVKGYGKPAGSWFNERYLGKKLGIARDGSKTFHSFRHTFATALFNADVPENKVAQVMGHVRGETMSGQRYNKDKLPSDLKPYVDRVDFNLPLIAPFDSEKGVEAVLDALDRKKRAARTNAPLHQSTD